MSRRIRQASPKVSAAELLAGLVLMFAVILLVAIALPIYFGADPAVPTVPR